MFEKVLKVDSSGVTEDSGAATVTAWVDETGDLYAASGETGTAISLKPVLSALGAS